MTPSSYGWAALAGLILAILITVMIWVRSGKRQAVQAAANAARGEDAARKALEHEAVAEVERRDLPGGVAGPRVRDVPGKLGGAPSSPGGA